jgi:hypothetical protein
MSISRSNPLIGQRLTIRPNVALKSYIPLGGRACTAAAAAHSHSIKRGAPKSHQHITSMSLLPLSGMAWHDLAGATCTDGSMDGVCAHLPNLR